MCAKVRDRFWEMNQIHWSRAKRDDPSTWDGPFADDEASTEQSDPSCVRGAGGYRLRQYIGAEQLLLDLLPRRMLPVAEQLLGEGEVQTPEGLLHGMPASGPVWESGQGTRGIYATLPQPPPAVPQPPGLHFDGGAEGRDRMKMTAYIDDVPEGAGGFTVWPKSHHRMWDTIWKHEGMSCRGDGTDPPHAEVAIVRAVRDQVQDDTPAVECHGHAGDVVLWHHRLLHAAGHNYHPGVIRQAIIALDVKVILTTPSIFH
jgi:hypothetical protein